MVSEVFGMGGAEGRRAVVTGAASGIGYAVVERLIDEGASVVAVDVNEAGMAPLAARGAELMVASVADPDDRDRIAEAAGSFDYLVNSAGVLFVKSIWEVELDEWRNLYAVNVEGTFFMCQRLGRQMRRGGAIMNLSSSSAKLSTTVEVTPYSSSKATIVGITRSFAYVLAKDGVRVNAILPGIIDTPMQDKVLDAVGPMRGTTGKALDEARMKLVPLGRAASPAECAGAIWWLLSDEAGYMTGQAINYTGGLVMW
jgi:NAD(P)-dependent dehydrogenase (short-subunit alcohol dehydrogenase family)